MYKTTHFFDVKIKDVLNELKKWAPPEYSEDFDNVGLLVGNEENRLSKCLISHDVTEEVIDEAHKNDCNLIISFHPIIFKGLKKIIGSNYVEKIVLKSIQKNISIYAIHTALDNYKYGVSFQLAKNLNLKRKEILIPKKNTLKKLNFLVPKKNADNIRKKLFSIGAGKIGNYDNCSFFFEGKGSFKGNENSKPFIGEKNQINYVKEELVSLIYEKHLENKVLKTLNENHPYEEVSYDIIPLDNINQDVGLGSVGFLNKKTDFNKFLKFVKSKLNCEVIKHSEIVFDKVEKIAVLGGSGSFAIDFAISKNAEVLVTSDLKYHDFFKANKKIILVDVGHYESEQFTKTLIFDHLKKKLPNFEVILSKINTNPIKYY